jgi:hypothetical protein
MCEVLQDKEKRQVLIRKCVIDMCAAVKRFEDDVKRVAFVIDSSSWRYNFYDNYKYALTKVKDDYYKEFLEVLNDFEAPATTYDDYGYGQYEEQEPVEVEMSEEMSAFWGVDTKSVANELEQNLNFSESSVKQVEQPSISMDDYDTCCSPEGISFKIISSVNFTDNTGCHLVKNQSGYAIMAFVGDRLSQIKTLGEISSEKIMARLSEKLDNGKDRYLVRVDNTKFLVNSDSNSVEYIMDL